MTNETLLLKIGIDNTEAVNRIAEQKKQLEALKAEKKELDKTDKNYTANLVILDRAIKQVNDSIRIQEKELDNTIKATKEAEGSNNQLRAQLALLTSQYNALSEEERTSTEAGQQMAQSIKSLSDQLKGNEGTVGDFRRSVGDYEGAFIRAANSIDGMKERLAAMKKELGGMEVGTTKFNDLNEEIQNLSLSIEQAEGKVNEFGEREPKNLLKKNIEDAFVSTTLLSQGLTTLNSIYGENTTLADANVKAIQAIALSQAAANVVKEKGAIIDTVANARMIAMTAAQKAYAIVVGNSTGAMKAFRVALAATGIGAVLVVLYELIFNFEKVNSLVKDLTGTVKNFMTQTLGMNETLVDTLEVLFSIINPIVGIIKVVDKLRTTFGNFTVDIEGLNKQLDANNEMIAKNIGAYERQEEMMKAVGASEQELAAARRAILAEEIRMRELQMQKAEEMKNKIVSLNGGLSEEEQKLYDSIKSTYDTATFNLEKFEAEQSKIRRDAAKERAKELADSNKRYLELMQQFELEAIAGEEERAIRMLEIERKAQIEEINYLKISGDKKAKAIEQIEAIINNKIEATRKSYRDASEKAAAEAEDVRLNDLIEYYNEQQRIVALNEELAIAQAENSLRQGEELERRKLEIKWSSMEQQVEIMRQLADADGILTEEELKNISILEERIKAVKASIAGDGDRVPTFAEAIGLDSESFDSINNGIQAVASMINQALDLQRQAIEQEIVDIDRRYDAEIARIDELKISEEAKEGMISELEKKRANEKYEMELKAFNLSKAMQITSAIIQTAQAVIAAFTAGASLGPAGVVMGPVMAATAGVLGATQIALIASQQPPQKPEFFEGGYTEKGNIYERSRMSPTKYDLHKGEYVVPAKVLSTAKGGMLVNELEAMRSKIKSTGYTPSGFFSGGYTGGMNSNDVSNIVAATVANANIVVRVSDVTNKQNAKARGAALASVS